MKWLIIYFTRTDPLTLQNNIYASFGVYVVNIISRRTKDSFDNFEVLRCVVKINVDFVSHKRHLRRRMIWDKS